MAGSITVSVFASNSTPKFLSHEKSALHQITKNDLLKNNSHSIFSRTNFSKNNMTKLFARLSEVEPDLNEDPKDTWATNGISACRRNLSMGSTMGITHTLKVMREEHFGDQLQKIMQLLDLLQDFRCIWLSGLMSWLFPPAVVAGMYFNAPVLDSTIRIYARLRGCSQKLGEYLFIGAAIFTVVFCVIEMNKPSEPHNFEPQIYNMERGARDKMISDYNSMNIWEFNEKYGELWDFTITKDDITKP